MRALLTFLPFLLSIILLQLSSGSIAPLDVLSGTALNFSTTQIGLLGSSHFIGFFIGCWWAPRLMGSVGHSRTFAIFTASGTIGAIAHTLSTDPQIWALLRIMTGLCVAGCYTVVEAWMQSMLTNQNRGRVMSVYRVIDVGASSLAQLFISVLEPGAYTSYNLLAILCCASMFPLVLSTAAQPQTSTAPRLRPLHTFRISPLGAAGVITSGLTAASFRMVGPIYGQELGLSATQIGYFLATVLIGGAAAQFPVGWLADRYDRRWVMTALSVLSVIVCGGVAILESNVLWIVLSGAALFGLVTFPIFSVASAHANDFTEPGKSVETNASLMFLYGIGAIFAPLLTSALVGEFGPSALFVFIAAAHLCLVGFSLSRMIVRPTVSEEKRTRYTYIPRTSFTIGRLIRRTGKQKP